jgi:hypothetical protein
MAAQRKYPDELRERAVKMVFEIRERDGKGHGCWPPAGLQLAHRSAGLDVHPPATENQRTCHDAEYEGESHQAARDSPSHADLVPFPEHDPEFLDRQSNAEDEEEDEEDKLPHIEGVSGMRAPVKSA